MGLLQGPRLMARTTKSPILSRKVDAPPSILNLNSTIHPAPGRAGISKNSGIKGILVKSASVQRPPPTKPRLRIVDSQTFMLLYT